MAQVIPPTTRHIQQLTSTCTWFIWKGAIFRVPITTLQRPEEVGGWALPDIKLKCRTLLLGRMRTLAARKETATAALVRKWLLTETVENPPHISKIPTKLGHIRQYALDMAYVGPQCSNETMNKQRRRIYRTLRHTKKTQRGATRYVSFASIPRFDRNNYALTSIRHGFQTIRDQHGTR
jgi:hypothetical protein